MSAILCGKRSFFEDIPSPPTVSKRVRCSSSSPVRFSPPRSASGSVSQSPWRSSSSSLLDYLFAVFPDMDQQLLEKALEECGDDLDLAIKSLTELRLGCTENNLGNAAVHSDIPPLASNQGDEEAAPTDVLSASRNLPTDGTEWVEFFVREILSSSNMDDARVRAASALEALKKSVLVHAGSEAAQNFQQENMILKEQVQLLIQENAILKRAVSIQHERQKEFDDQGQEVRQLKQLVSQYQEQLRMLQINNYALAMHLKQAQQSNSIPGRFNPDVF